jgi:hypothetical protein
MGNFLNESEHRVIADSEEIFKDYLKENEMTSIILPTEEQLQNLPEDEFATSPSTMCRKCFINRATLGSVPCGHKWICKNCFLILVSSPSPEFNCLTCGSESERII